MKRHNGAQKNGNERESGRTRESSSERRVKMMRKKVEECARALARARASGVAGHIRRLTSATPSNEDGKAQTHGGRLAALSVVSAFGALALTRMSDAAMAEDVEFAAYGAATPLLRALDAERAHDFAIAALALGFAPRARRVDDERLRVSALGREFANPIGLAAGFDKDAKAFAALLGVGFGFVEIGSVTPKAQKGNDKPRVFRLTEHGAVINRYGFNSEGHEEARTRLAAYRAAEKSAAAEGKKPSLGLIGVNLGKNKSTPEDSAADDYVLGVETIGEFGDYIVVNVSSPNTPGLRNLQGPKHLSALLRKVLKARDSNAKTAKIPVLVKIAPDLTEAALKDIAHVVKSERVDGVIVSNTTVARPDAIKAHEHGNETGGLSGKPLMEPSTKVLHDLYALTGGKVTLIGSGGVASGEDAYQKIRAGASLVQLYTAFAYEGPALIPRIKRELVACLERDGFKSVQEAVGTAHKRK